jgi:nitrilase
MKVAAIQAAPVFLQREATTEKVLQLMREAARQGTQLCVFPETFLPGYPVWLMHLVSSLSEAQRQEAYARYLEAAVDPNGPEMQAIQDEAKRLGLFTYLGFVERAQSSGTVYCSLAAIHPDRGVLSIHRKLKPTYFERLIWGDGDGAGLQVHEWKGIRVGGLNCFENWMPLARHALYAQGEELHVSTWPGRPAHTRDLSRFIATEGRVYVIAAAGVLTTSDIPDSFPLKAQLAATTKQFWDGGTVVVGPEGDLLSGPAEKIETIVYADIDAKKVHELRMRFDAAGHYGRPDIFSFGVNRERQNHIR